METQKNQPQFLARKKTSTSGVQLHCSQQITKKLEEGQKLNKPMLRDSEIYKSKDGGSKKCRNTSASFVFWDANVSCGIERRW